MQAQISIRLPYTSTTLPAACLSSEVSGNRSLSTGKERDTESGNDYFGARYYASTTGRFLSPDWSAKAEPVPYAKLGNPQTLNLYSYANNNPLSFVDPDGHCWAIISWWQHLCNKVDGLGWRSDAQVENDLHDAHLWLRRHGITAEQQEKMSDKQILDVTSAAQKGKSSVISDEVKFTIQFGQIAAGLFPGAKPDWGKNRVIKELHDQGYVYDGPAKGEGQIYKNPQTGEEIRIMENPDRTPYRGEPTAKHENDYYYRYRSGPDQPWQEHVPIPDK